MKKVAILAFVLGLCSYGLLMAQNKVAFKPQDLAGNWELVVEAEGMVINLNLVLVMENGVLTGKMSEPYGTFSDLPVAELKVEEDILSFILSAPSPPDGLTRTWKWELKVSGNELEGIVYNSEIGISASVRGKRAS